MRAVPVGAMRAVVKPGQKAALFVQTAMPPRGAPGGGHFGCADSA
jgi:hypothetical protein